MLQILSNFRNVRDHKHNDKMIRFKFCSCSVQFCDVTKTTHPTLTDSRDYKPNGASRKKIKNKKFLTALSSLSSLPPLLLSLSRTLSSLSHSAFFPLLSIWSAFILWDWGRKAVTGWNAWANAAFHIRKGATPGISVWLLKPTICHPLMPLMSFR